MKKYAIILAGGSGSRMNSDIPKQFLLLKGKPILMHTLAKFYESDATIQIILVLPQQEQKVWEEFVKKYNFSIAHTVVSGGKTRFQSVNNGLSQTPLDALVAIHDGVRPFASKELISQSYKIAQQSGSAIAAVASKDSLRLVHSDGKNEAVNRSHYRIIQTPQTFQSTLIKKAFEVEEQAFFTDDASVLEYAGNTINLIEGDYRNIKITTPEDLLVAEAFVQ